MLGERICLLRRRQGWSQAELARRLQVSPSAIGMYEQGRREPSLEAVAELSRTFGVSMDYLVTGKPVNDGDAQAMQEALTHSLEQYSQGHRGLSSEELAVLYAAMLTES